MRTVRPLLRPAAVAASLLAVVALSSCGQEDSDEPSAPRPARTRAPTSPPLRTAR